MPREKSAYESLFWTVREASQILGKSEAWMRDKIKCRKIRFHKLGGSVMIKKADLDRWISQSVVEPVKRRERRVSDGTLERMLGMSL